MTEEEKEVTGLFHEEMEARGVPRWSYYVNIERSHPYMSLEGDIRVAVIRDGFAQTARLRFVISEDLWIPPRKHYHVEYAVDQVVRYIEKETA